MEMLGRKSECNLTEKVLQFGEGNFLRGFVDWMIDRLNKECNWNGGIVIVQPRAGGHAEELNKQDGLYSLYMRGRENGEPKEETVIIESVTRGINPYIHYDEYIKCAENPGLRFIVSNTTEAGIEYKEGQDENNFAELTFPGKLASFMKRRFDLGFKGFIVLPCELIDKNGDILKKYILKYADDWNYGGAFAKWINEENYFANTLVDRIVTGYPKKDAESMQKKWGYRDCMIDTAELFHLWVIESGKEIAEEIPFDKAGLNVLWKDDIMPYKTRKVRILNGAHTMLVPASFLVGFKTVRDVMNNSIMAGFVRKGIFDEIIPTLDPDKGELEKFAEDVLERFDNPFIEHYLLDIALNSVSKFRVRVLPSIIAYKEKFGKEPDILLFSLAALIAFYKGESANDLPEVMEFMRKSSVDEILSNEDYWGRSLMEYSETVNKYYNRICSENIVDIIADF